MEANDRAFHSALHEALDGSGFVEGIGGGFKAIAPSDYGPGGAKIDTHRPFRVHAAFEADAAGEFAAMTVTLEQRDFVQFSVTANRDPPKTAAVPACARVPEPEQCSTAPFGQCGGHEGVELWPCEKQCCPTGQECAYQNDYYSGCKPGSGEFTPMSRALRDGMTPIFSYWSAPSMSWLDKDVCAADDQTRCGEVATFSELAVCEGLGLCQYAGPREVTREEGALAAGGAGAAGWEGGGLGGGLGGGGVDAQVDAPYSTYYDDAAPSAAPGQQQPSPTTEGGQRPRAGSAVGSAPAPSLSAASRDASMLLAQQTAEHQHRTGKAATPEHGSTTSSGLDGATAHASVPSRDGAAIMRPHGAAGAALSHMTMPLHMPTHSPRAEGVEARGQLGTFAGPLWLLALAVAGALVFGCGWLYVRSTEMPSSVVGYAHTCVPQNPGEVPPWKQEAMLIQTPHFGTNGLAPRFAFPRGVGVRRAHAHMPIPTAEPPPELPTHVPICGQARTTAVSISSSEPAAVAHGQGKPTSNYRGALATALHNWDASAVI